MAEDRGIGRTTKQLEAAKRGALFVVHHPGFVDYVKDLAKHLDREDIRVTHPEQLFGLRGLQFPEVVIDHHLETQLTLDDRAEINWFRFNCCRL